MMASGKVIRVDTLGLCVFCLRQSDSFISSDSQSLSHVLTYIQPKWTTTNDENQYKFFIRRKLLDNPPICSSCRSDVSQIESCHQELVELERLMKEVKVQLESYAENVRGKMKKGPGANGEDAYAERYERLVKVLRRNEVSISCEVVSDTIVFLSQLQGNCVNSTRPESNLVGELVSASPISSVPNEALSRLNSFRNESRFSAGLAASTVEQMCPPPTVEMIPSTEPIMKMEVEAPFQTAPAPTNSGKRPMSFGSDGEEDNDTSPAPEPLLKRKRKQSSTSSSSSSSEEEGDVEEWIQPEDDETEVKIENDAEDLMNSSEKDPLQDESESEVEKPVDDPNWVAPCDRDKVKRKLKGIYKRALQMCDMCGVNKLATEMPSHMASHVGEYAFRCPNPECEAIFITKWSNRYSKHVRSSYSNKKCVRAEEEGQCLRKLCDTCGKDFENLVSFANHLKEEHETLEKKFTCPVENCGQVFTVKQSVEYHLLTHTLLKRKSLERSKLAKCSSCGEKVREDQMGQHHMEEHGLEEDKLVRCQQCPFSCSSHEELLNHLGKHLKDGAGAKCGLCQEEGEDESRIPYLSLPLLRKHYFEKHGIGKMIICEKDNCEFTAFSSVSMGRHIRVVHKGKDPKPFKCDECSPPQGFSLRWRLENHKMKVHGADLIKCKYCAATFSSVETKQKHEKFEHEGKETKRRVCDLCGANLTVGSYKFHMKSKHEISPKEEKCDQCDATFKNKKCLCNHVRRVHEGRDERICEVCGQKLKNSIILEGHMRIHTGERPYQCTICLSRFRQKCTWRKHMKLHKEKGDKFEPRGTFDRSDVCKGSRGNENSKT